MDFGKGGFHFSGKEMFYQNLLDCYSKIFLYFSVTKQKGCFACFLFCLNEAFAVP